MIEQLQNILLELGTALLEWRADGLTGGEWQDTQFKSEADVRAHNFLGRALMRTWPHIPVVSEEDLASITDTRPEEYWLIDPIDGTASFCSGFDGFVTQAALVRGDEPVMGAVHAPALGLTYGAVRGGVATCNGAEITRQRVNFSKPVLIDNYPQPRGIAAKVFEGLPCGGYVESGSLGLKICRVADGTADVFVKDVIVKDWDLAPAHLVLDCVGGILTTFDGSPVSYSGSFEDKGLVACGTPELCAQVNAWLREFDAIDTASC